MPRCQRWKCLDKVVCDQLTNPAYGTVEYSDRRFEDTATYSCNCGYELDGCSKRTCLSDGTWSDNAPSCRGVFLLHLGQSFFYFSFYGPSRPNFLKIEKQIIKEIFFNFIFVFPSDSSKYNTGV